MTRARLAIALLVVVLTLAGCSSQTGQQAKDPPSAPATSKTDPAGAKKPLDFSIQTLGEQPVTVSGLRDGKPALIEFWGST